MESKKQLPAGSTGMLMRAISSVIRAGAIGGMCFLVAMMLLTTANVLLRYAANRPIIGAEEIVGLLLVCLTAAAVGYCQSLEGHVRVTILSDRLSRRGQAIVDSLAYLIGLVGISLICWYLFAKAEFYVHLTRGNVTEILGIYYYPFMFLLLAGFILFALVLVMHLAKSVKGALKHE